MIDSQLPGGVAHGTVILDGADDHLDLDVLHNLFQVVRAGRD